MRVTVGPDGYLATDDAPEFAAQSLLADHLGERQKTGDGALAKALPRLRKLAKPAQADLIRAIHHRIGWIDENAAELSEPKRWQSWLAQLARALYSPSLPLDEADFILMLESHRRRRALWGFGPEELLVAWLDTHELSPALAAELRRFQADLRGVPGGMRYQSQSAYQAATQHVYMLLWHDEADPLDPKRCWSDLVRADYRAMTGDRKAAWRAIFRHIRGNAPAKPPKGWVTGAEALLDRLGTDAFVERFLAWFEPLAGTEPQRLEVAGSHVLRGLLWYAAIVGDPRLPPAALCLLDTKWKARKNVDKAMVALVQIMEAMAPETAWPSLLRLQQEWPTTSVQVERLLKETAARFGITEEELKARALLKPKLDIGRRMEDVMDKLITALPMVRRQLGE